MPKPHWEKLHDEWERDFHDWKWHRWCILGLLQAHPGNPLLLESAKLMDKLIAVEQGRYNKIYGVKCSI